MKKVFFALVIISQLFAISAQAASRKQRHVQRIVEQIALGRTEVELLALLSETVTLNEDKNVNITDICRYDYFRKIFKGVVNYNAATQEYFAFPAVVKKYVVEDCSALWPFNSRMEFYFQREFESNDPFTLFAIRSVLKLEVSDVATAFQKNLNTGVENRHGQQPLVLNTTYYSREAKTPLPTKMAVWEMATSREFLLVADNGMLIFPEFIYMDRVEGRSCLESMAKYKESLKGAKPKLMYEAR